MGGFLSGPRNHWWRDAAKTTVEECLSLDANRWMREGILKAGQHASGSWQWTYRSGGRFSINYEANTLDMTRPKARLWYTWRWGNTSRQFSADYSVRIAASRPHFGGLRWWFLCPLVHGQRPCERRVAKLYLPPVASYFGCRKCHDLTYTSCQESHKFDHAYRRMAAELGCSVEDLKREFSDQ